MTPEQITQITALGYFVVNHGQHVEDTNKNIVVGKDADGNYVTDIPEIQKILGEVKKVRARNKTKAKVEETELVMERARDENGHFIADDPDTEVNEAWVVKTVKKVFKKK